MDQVDDATYALIVYTQNLDAEDEKGQAYLIVYGVLQALYLQQDAVFWWCKFMKAPTAVKHEEPVAWIKTLPELVSIRELRHSTAGHPVRPKRRYGKPHSTFFISHVSLSRRGFDLMEAIAGHSSQFTQVNLPDLVKRQAGILAEALRGMVDDVDRRERAHYRKFMDRPLTKIMDRIDLSLRDLASKKRAKYAEMLPSAIRGVRAGLLELRQAIDKRDERFDRAWSIPFVMRALSLLEDYVGANKSNCDDDLADVAAEYVRYAVADYREMTLEIDKRYEAARQQDDC
jgi:hypothetical protein